MAEELKNPAPSGDMGHPDSGSVGGQTTDTESLLSSDGQAGGDQDATTIDGPHKESQENTFFDPRDISDKPELMAAYKGMQSAYTKKMQQVADQRHKVEAYDAFYADPIGQVQRVAQQYGYKLNRAEAAAVANQNEVTGQDPQNWNDVYDRATTMAEKRIMEKLGPVFNQVQNMRRQSIESSLSEIDPTWQQYEDQMRSNLQTHPTLATDPAMLYRLSVPADVLESRATQAALKKLETRQRSAGVAGTSTTNRSPQSGLPDKAVSFQDAVAAAKKALSEQGIRPG